MLLFMALVLLCCCDMAEAAEDKDAWLLFSPLREAVAVISPISGTCVVTVPSEKTAEEFSFVPGILSATVVTEVGIGLDSLFSGFADLQAQNAKTNKTNVKIP